VPPEGKTVATDTLSTLDKLVKDQYLPGLQNFINKRRPLTARLEKLGKEVWVGGRQMVLAVQTTDAQSVGPISEDELLPAPTGPGIVNMTLAMKYYYATARLSAQVIHSASTDAGGFARSVNTVLDSVKNQLADEMWIDSVYGDGSGVIGEVASYSGTTLVTKVQPTVGQLGTALLRVNQLLSSYTAKSAGSIGADGVKMTAKTTVNATVPGSAGFGTNDYLFRAVTAGTDPRNKSLMGLGGLVD
jgi:hypothetical protein